MYAYVYKILPKNWTTYSILINQMRKTIKVNNMDIYLEIFMNTNKDAIFY